jgi:hypothetical protein
MEEVLAAEPWSEQGWELVVKPYLLKFAGETEKATLLKLLKRNPWMANFFLEKGWREEAEPILREHLQAGKTLPKKTVTYLAGLREPGMGEALVNQLLRMRGDFDDVARTVRNHPGVNWDEVRREAWRRMATGFGSHHVWRQWGVEIGEKEALRQFLAEAESGKEWERTMLEKWFETEGDVVEQLRKNWHRLVFRNGKWSQG